LGECPKKKKRKVPCFGPGKDNRRKTQNRNKKANCRSLVFLKMGLNWNPPRREKCNNGNGQGPQLGTHLVFLLLKSPGGEGGKKKSHKKKKSQASHRREKENTIPRHDMPKGKENSLPNVAEATKVNPEWKREPTRRENIKRARRGREQGPWLN